MSWQLYTALTIILTSIATLLQKVLMKDDKTDPAASAIFYQIIMMVLISLLMLFTGQYNFSGISTILPNLLIMTLLIGGFYLFIFKSLKLIDVSEFIIILSLRPLFTILSSTLFLDEGLNTKQFIGVVAILAGVIIVTMNKIKIGFGKGEFYALFAAACLGFANTNDRYVLLSFSLLPYIFLSAILPAAFLTATNIKKLPLIKPFFELNVLKKMLLMAVFQFASTLTLLKAFQIGNNSSQISSLTEINVILTVLIGIVLLREHDNTQRKLLGSGLSVIGLILLG